MQHPKSCHTKYLLNKNTKTYFLLCNSFYWKGTIQWKPRITDVICLRQGASLCCCHCSKIYSNQFCLYSAHLLVTYVGSSDTIYWRNGKYDKNIQKSTMKILWKSREYYFIHDHEDDCVWELNWFWSSICSVVRPRVLSSKFLIYSRFHNTRFSASPVVVQSTKTSKRTSWLSINCRDVITYCLVRSGPAGTFAQQWERRAPSVTQLGNLYDHFR